MDRPPATADYGTTRNRRPTVSYAEFERTASALLAKGDKPGLDNVRKAIGGSPETIRQMLRRYWIELSARSQGPSEALARLPSEIADLADELWQRSMTLAAERSVHDDNAARERLEQVKRENEVRSHTLAVKERAFNEREAIREKVVSELRDQVATLLSIVSRNTETLGALQASKAEVEVVAEGYRQRLTQVLARAVARNHRVTSQKPRPAERLVRAVKRRSKIKRPRRTNLGIVKRTKSKSTR